MNSLPTPTLECNGAALVCHASLDGLAGPSTSYNTVVHLDKKESGVFYGPVAMSRPPNVSVTLSDAVSCTSSTEVDTVEEVTPGPSQLKAVDRRVPVKQQQPTHPPPDYVTIAIVMCFCFPLIGVPFLLFSCMARSASSRGNLPLAWEYSHIAMYLFTAEMVTLALSLAIALVMIWLGNHVTYFYVESVPKTFNEETPKSNYENAEIWLNNITNQGFFSDVKSKLDWDNRYNQWNSTAK